ncbi:filamentation induced by cAMP protein Fic [Pirellula staleyi DSM 6068]|uniref:Filamentation induced by cAMP protein Fic n=1 Tax=Pirellula staleyi (strain ATCC 27377 / DSM 6068 / ICPB 4128) TaxID=530564 RepID=D2R4H6_PIRSD|nr:Fic/DOC family N-terminal domain-containing protein [Pirellula staleyi]ADB15324.1 filamentation induced by cAMP protein Fic [Pirellula staleyi DSM 6068]
MDIARFSAASPGQTIEIRTPARDWAFLPDALPPCDWRIPEHLWPLIADAREALGTLNGIGQTLPDPTLLVRPLQNRESLASSSIEGTFVTPEQLLLYQLDPEDQPPGNHQAADWQEVANYTAALQQGVQLLVDLPICNRVIRQMHRVLMQGVRGFSKSPGEFRKRQVLIGSQGRFIPPPAEHVEPLMSDLEHYVNLKPSSTEPLIACFLVHYQFETIYPFEDGNGRVGRALLALMIYKLLGHSHPWLYLSPYFEEYRDEYMRYLFEVSSQGAWNQWIEFCLRGTIHQAHDARQRCLQFNQLRKTFHSRISAPTARSYRLIESLFSEPIVTIPSVARKLGIAYHTAQEDIKRLVNAGILAPLEHRRPKAFSAQAVIDVAYRSSDV